MPRALGFHRLATVPEKTLDHAYKHGPGFFRVGDFNFRHDGRMMVAWPQASSMYKDSRNELSVIVYPQEGHKRAFLEAAKGVKEWGPSEERPGSVGSLTVIQEPGSPIVLERVQAHFMKEGNVHLKRAEYGLSKPLVRHYSPWRRRAFDALLDLAERTGSQIKVPDSVFDRGNFAPFGLQKHPALLKEIATWCDKKGLRMDHVHDNGAGYSIIDPKQRKN